ncbi:MAG: hypothetical protein ACRD7E_03945, partial [Bryobacteraceae bacterium]
MSAQAARGGSKGKKKSADLGAPRESVVREFIERPQAARRGSKGKKNSVDLPAPRESVVREFLKRWTRKIIRGSSCYPECVPLRYLVAGLLMWPACSAQAVPLLDILGAELQRNFNVLKEKADPPPYFLAYSVVEQESEVITGTLGTLETQNRRKNRILDVTVRVGSPQLDNYRQTRGERVQFTSATLLPLEDVPDSINRILWAETDENFRKASQRLINLRTSTKVDVAGDDASDDFSQEEASVYIEKPSDFEYSSREWADRVRAWSGEVKKFSGVLSSEVSVRFHHET